MKYLILAALLSCTSFAQQAEKDSGENILAVQAAANKAATEKKSSDDKAKAEAAAKLDNKNPQPIKSESDRLRLEKLQARALLDQQKLQTMEAMIKASMQQPIAQAQASAKAYNDALAELQKSHHAEGCTPIYDEHGDLKVSKDGKEVWNCPTAAASKEK